MQLAKHPHLLMLGPEADYKDAISAQNAKRSKHYLTGGRMENTMAL